MTDLVVETIVCQRCRAELDPADNYCRRCGTPTTSLGFRQPNWSESPWVVLPLLFLILGPLALPLLWRSRAFTITWKIALTVGVTALTGYLVWHVWLSMQQAMAPLRNLDKQLGL